MCTRRSPRCGSAAATAAATATTFEGRFARLYDSQLFPRWQARGKKRRQQGKEASKWLAYETTFKLTLIFYFFYGRVYIRSFRDSVTQCNATSIGNLWKLYIWMLNVLLSRLIYILPYFKVILIQFEGKYKSCNIILEFDFNCFENVVNLVNSGIWWGNEKLIRQNDDY